MVVFVIAVIGAQQNAKEVGISIPHLFLSVLKIISRSTSYHKELLSEQITNNLVVMVG